MPRSGWLPALLVLALGGSASAQDAFEIQVYDSETAPVLRPGIEVHFNYDVMGVREAGPAGELPTDHVAHLTFEPHLGVARWGEVGFYLQTAVRPDGDYDYAGVKLRFKARVPRLLAGHVGLALNGELSLVPRAYGPRWGSELRPILDVRAGRFYFAVNPIFSFDLEGPLVGRPQFEPAAKAELVLHETIGVGAEYYAGLGPIEAPFAASQQVHRLFGVIDLLFRFRRVEVGLQLGAGAGFAAGERWIVKSIFGVQLVGPAEGERPPAPRSG